MQLRPLDRVLLALIAIFLGIIALRPLMQPVTAHAQPEVRHLYIEPGTTMLHVPGKDRHVLGKVGIDLTNGDVWGFPTFSELPYPYEPTKTTPPVSRPVYMGKYDFSALDTAP